ncbi:MAG TPA: tetratricopeptide repeat protein [Candidatus Acidoferrum sp.]|jgi:tetratricopeptide (TPR) repeat protein
MKKQFIWPGFLLLAILGGGYWWWQRPIPLSNGDSLLVSDLVNESGDPVFDSSLTVALRVSLEQSPYFNLVADQKARNALKRLGQPDQQPLTAELSKAICASLGAKAFTTGTVRKAESGYSVKLETIRCADATQMAHAEASAVRSDMLIHALGTAATSVRTQLGESQESVQKLDVPLERATTPIPAALKAYEQARKTNTASGDLDAVPFYKKAIELDSRFALARSGLAVSYYNLSQMGLAGEQIRQAYEEADRQTFRERLNVATLYYDLAQGDIDKAIEGYKEYIRAYPHDDVAMGNLSSEFFVTGDYEQAAKYAEEALKIDPDSPAWYENYSTALMALSRTDEAEKVLKEALARKLDDASLHSNLYSLGFLKGDKALMEQQLVWAQGKPNGEDSLLASQSDTEAYYGRLAKAREYTERAVQAAQKAELPESAATWRVESAMREAMFGNTKEAGKDAQEALKLAPESKDVRAQAALVFARVGDMTQAQNIIDNLRALYVSNMAIQKAWLPVVRAQMEIHANRNTEAVQLLEIVAPYEKGQLTGNLSDSCMIPAYLRAEAFMRMQKNHEALTEFHKIQSFPGITGSCWSGPLSKLGDARATAQGGSTAEAKLAYQKFFELWKDADSDIPLLKEAKAEAAKLR